MLPINNKTIVARCDWSPWVLSRENGTLGFASGALFPLGCTKRHGPRHSVQRLYNGTLSIHAQQLTLCKYEQDTNL